MQILDFVWRERNDLIDGESEREERGFRPGLLVPPLRAPYISVDAVPTSIESIYKLATMHTLGAGLLCLSLLIL